MAKYDNLFLNGNIYSLEKEGESFCAMAVKNGKVSALFSENPKDAEKISKKVTDLKGATVLPGFTDCHMHFMATAALRETALTASEIVEGRFEPHDLKGFELKLKSFASKIKPKLPIICFSYVIASMDEDRLPVREELDTWLPGRVVIVISMDCHSSAWSSEALKHIGIADEKHDGILSGESHDMNMGKINDLIEKSMNLPVLLSGISNVVNDAVNYGIVGLHCLEGFEDSKKDVSLWLFGIIGRLLPLNIKLFIQYRNIERVHSYTKKMSYKRLGGCNSWEMDGSISSKTAAFFEPYKDEENNFGKCYYSQQDTDESVRIVNENKYQLSSHAIGTRAIETILSAYEKVLAPDYTNPYRHRIEHFEFPTKEQVGRAVKCNLILTAQPGYSWTDETYHKAYRKYLSDEQYNRQIPLKTITRMGGIILGSSDSPVQHINPFIQIHGMVNYPIESERLSVYEALRTYTWNSAFSAFEESHRGTLKQGKAADFILLDKDPFKIPSTELIDIKVTKTYISARIKKRYRLTMFGLLAAGIFSKRKFI